MPVFLITVFSKGERANLSQAERNALKDLAGELIAAYAAKVVKASRRR